MSVAVSGHAAGTFGRVGIERSVISGRPASPPEQHLHQSLNH